MLRNRLLIEFNDDDPWVKLRREFRSGVDDEAFFELPSGFSRSDVRTALLATGRVTEHGSDLLLPAGESCQRLGRLLSDMFSYFDGTAQPGPQLRAIEAAVAAYGLTPDACPTMPLWTLAWLDLVVREDLADDARSREGIWSRPDFLVQAEAHCRRRVEEVLRRYGQPAPQIPSGRMAASSRTLASSLTSQTKTGS